MNEYSKSDEIDLRELLKPLIAVRNAVLSYLRRLNRSKWWILAFVTLIAIAAFIVRPMIPRYYRTEAIFVSHTLDASLCSSLLNSLSEFQKDDRNKLVLARQWGISEKAVESIYSINAEPNAKFIQLDNQDTLRSIFTVELIVKDNLHIPEIQQGIISYLENNEYATKRKSAKRRTLELENQNYELEMKSLDSLKQIVNNSIIPRGSGNGIILGEPIDPVRVYQAGDSFYKAFLQNLEKLAIKEDIEVIQSFLSPSYYNYPNSRKALLLIIALAILLAIIIIPFIPQLSDHQPTKS